VRDMGEESIKQRKERRDKGSRLLTARDRRVLAWIAEQYAVRFDHVRRLLSATPGHTSPRFVPGPGGVSDSDVLQVVRRWEQEPAWAVYRRYYIASPGWIWATPHCIDVLAGMGMLPAYGRHFLRESTLEHLHWTNAVRLECERRHPGSRWVSERSIRRMLGRREEGDDLVHIPDGQLWLDERRMVAIEVELSPKSESEYDAILDELLVSGVIVPDQPTAFVYQAVWYFVSYANDVRVQAARSVSVACSRLSEEYSRRVQIISLEKVVQP